MHGLVFAFGALQQIDSIGGEAKTIAKLLDSDACPDHRQALRLYNRQIDIQQVGDVERKCHRDDAATKAVMCDADAAYYSSCRQSYHAQGAV